MDFQDKDFQAEFKTIEDFLNHFDFTDAMTFVHVASYAMRESMSFKSAYEDIGAYIYLIFDKQVDELHPLFAELKVGEDLLGYINIVVANQQKIQNEVVEEEDDGSVVCLEFSDFRDAFAFVAEFSEETK